VLNPGDAAPTAPALPSIDWPRDEPRTVRVALAGCGVVGGALAASILDRGGAIEAEQGIRLELVRVLVRRPDVRRTVPASLLTSDVDAFLATDADVVVEALGGVDPAGRIARHVLTRGARLVTANKALVAAAGAELAALAANGGAFDFEAAVGGGIPIVRALRDALGQVPVRRIQGIVNGTCNYVLSRMEAGESFRDAVAEAQRLGYAEADPTRDLDGTDAAEKLAILAWLAFGVPPHQVGVRTRGILDNADELAARARATGGRVRLLAECRPTPEGVAARVAPVVVAAGSGFGRTTGVENRIALDLGWEGELALCGPGAGGGPTAAALLGDLLRGCAPLPARRPRAVADGAGGADRPRAHVASRAGAPSVEAP
jgi:homoserine dehydrogenase